MKQYINHFAWYLYGGCSCFCIQRFLVDFVSLNTTIHELFESGDICVLDVWNRSNLQRNQLIYAISPYDHHKRIVGKVVATRNQSINVNPINRRVKLVHVPKGNVAVEILSKETPGHIQIIPLGLVQGKVLGRVWPIQRYSSRLSEKSTSDD